MKKIAILIIALFLVTGCSVKYNVIINEDLSVSEEAKLEGTEDLYKIYYKTTKKHVLENILNLYKATLEENSYQYELVEDKEPYVIVNKKYDSIKDYIDNSKLFNDYFDEIKYTENKNIRRIETIGYNENDVDNPDRFVVEKLKIAITSSYIVKNHNAKDVNKNTNTYYYELDNENDKILLEYDISKKFDPKMDLIKKITIALIIVVIIWIAVIILTKKNKKKLII